MPNWIKLHDGLLDSDVFSNEKTLKIWIWLLLKANWKNKMKSITVGKGIVDVNLKRGQVLFGRYSAESQLDMNGSTIYRHMQKLQNLGNIKIESNSHYSVITICKYDSYQKFAEQDEHPTNNTRTADEQHANNTRTTREQHANTSIEGLDSIDRLDIIISEQNQKNENMVSLEKKKCFTSIMGIGDIEVEILQAGEDWWLIEIERFVTQSQERFIGISNLKPILKKGINFQIVLQEFINHIQAGGADPKEANEIRKHFKNWLVKQNGSLEILIKDRLSENKPTSQHHTVIKNANDAAEYLQKEEENKGSGGSKEDRIRLTQIARSQKK